MLNKVLGKIERGYAKFVAWMMVLLGILVQFQQLNALGLFKIADWFESGIISQSWGVAIANKLYILEQLLYQLQGMISSLMAIFGWYSARSFAGWFLVITGSVLLISKMKATDESPKQVNYILVTLKFFNLFVAGVLVFVCYFTVTMLYFPDLAFSVESMWNSWFGIFNTLDAMVIYCLVALGSANLLIIGEFYKQPKAGWVIWCCNILMGIIWIVMETPSNAVSLDSAMILLVFTTAFHTISSLTIMFTGAPETK